MVRVEFSYNKENLKTMDSSEMLSDKINFLIHKRTQNYIIGHSYRFAMGEKKTLQVTRSVFFQPMELLQKENWLMIPQEKVKM